jgi:hypothetical protein
MVKRWQQQQVYVPLHQLLLPVPAVQQVQSKLMRLQRSP